MTDGTEHPGGAAAPGQGPQNAQPTPPGPQGSTQAPSGYGYPQQTPNPYPPQSGYQQPPQFQQPAFQQSPQFQQSPFGAAPQPFAPSPAEPNWEALAEVAEAGSRRRRRLWTGGIILAACVLGVGVGTVVIKGVGPKPQASASGSPKPGPTAKASGSSAPTNSPTVPGQPNLLADHSGQANMAISPDAKVDPVQGGYALRFASNPNSYAQSADQVVDVTKSFTLSAWVYNEAADSYRSAISEGDGVSYSFDLGRDDSNGRKSWLFSVQTADGGADGTSYHVLSQNVETVGQWVLLTATYDVDQQTIALYVNGAPAASTKVPGIWAGPGPLQFGRTRHHSQWGGYWAGVIGHIQIWNQALTPAQVAALKSGGALTANPTNSWLLG